jgi:hypothetical protein
MPKINAKTRTPQQDNAPRLLYDRKSAALSLSISIRSLDYLVARRQLAFRKIGKKVVIPQSGAGSVRRLEPLWSDRRMTPRS